MCAALLRHRGGVVEVLAFEHPLAGVQLVKGTVERGEELAAAVVRELEEESGVVDAVPTALIGTWDRVVGAGPREDGPAERHRWHVFTLRSTRPLPDEWDHVARGSSEEDGLVFRLRWLVVDEWLAEQLHPLFGDVVRLLRSHLAAG